MRKDPALLFLMLSLLLVAPFTAASSKEGDAENKAEDNKIVNEWQYSAGIGVFSGEQLWKGAGTLTAPMPVGSISYGRWSFLSDGLVSYKLPKVGGVKLQVGLNSRDEGYDSSGLIRSSRSDDPVFVGYDSPDNEVTATLKASWLFFSLNIEQDISDKSGGLGVGLGAKYPIFSKDKFNLLGSLSVDWIAEDYARHIYGVEGAQVDNSVGRINYLAEAATNYTAGIMATYQINKKWTLVSGLNHTLVDEAISDSPLVEQETLNRLFVFATYKF